MVRCIFAMAGLLSLLATCWTVAADDVAASKPAGKTEGKYVKLINVGSGKVLAVEGDSEDDETPAIVAKNSDNAPRQWKLEKDGDYLKLVNRKSGKVLDVSGESQDEDGAIIQYSDKTDGADSTDNQRWQWQGDGPQRRLTSKSSQLVLDVNEQGYVVQRKSDAKSKTQLWRIVDVPVYVKIVNVDSGKILGVTDDSEENESQAMLTKDVPATDKNCLARQWKIEKLGDYWMLVNRKSGKSLDVSNWSTDDDGAIIVYDAKSETELNDNQQWTWQAAGNNHDGKNVDSKNVDSKGRRIRSRSSGLVLDVDMDGKIVQRHADENAKSQLWRVTEVNE